jgi:formate/nitrite transporter
LDKSFFSPAEIAEGFIETGRKKAALSPFSQFALGILAGAFIAFAAEGSNVAIHTMASVGLAKALAGALFSVGLMLVIVAGGELFTGNCLMVLSLSERKISLGAMLRNWAVVYLGNFAGAILVAFLVLCSGQLGFSGGLLGGFTIKVAAYKTSLSFIEAFVMGIMCNWLVCLAVWMAAGTKDMAGKLLAIFFPIWLFVTSGFEHSIANMYYIPAGIFAKGNQAWVNAAISLGSTQEKIDSLTWASFALGNLLPVTLGNIVGGGLFVGMAYWFIYLRGSASRQKQD